MSTLQINSDQRRGTAFLCHVIRLLGPKLAEVRRYLNKPEYFESTRMIKGKKRKLFTPFPELMKIQRLILEFVLSEMSVSSAAHAAIFKRSIVTNANPHRKSRSFFRIDFKDTFPSITRKMVFDCLQKTFTRNSKYFEKHHSCTPEKLTVLASVVSQLTTHHNELPQGAPASSCILNLLCFDLDFFLMEVARKWDLVYTRYADDLWFSSKKVEMPLEARKEIVQIIKANTSLKINRKKISYKTSLATVPRITGLTIVSDRKRGKRISFPREQIERYRTIIHKAAIDDSISKNKIFGIMGLTRMVNKGQIPARLKSVFRKFLEVRCPEKLDRYKDLL